MSSVSSATTTRKSIGPVTAPWYHRRVVEDAESLQVSGRLTVIPGLKPEDPRLKAAMRDADLFVLPSLHEPFGIAALEAWAAGLPLIAAATGGLRDFIVPGRNGLLFAPDDPESLLRCYDELTGDKALSARLRANALADVQSFNWEALSGRLLELYRELIHARA